MRLRKRHVAYVAIVASIAGASYYAKQVSQPVLVQSNPVPAAENIKCDDLLWQHVYAGDPRKFKAPQNRLQVITPCVSVSGVIINAAAEADGDFHVRLDLDSQYKSMLNAMNTTGQHGYLVLEPVCSNPVTQKDTIQEGSCSGFSQHIYDQSMVGKHVEVIGAYVTDMEHGWNEIHPVTSITVR